VRDDETVKEALGRLYHHDTLRWTLLGALGKLIVELGFCTTVAVGFVLIGRVLPISLPLPALGNSPGFWLAVGGLAVTILNFLGCFSTPAPD